MPRGRNSRNPLTTCQPILGWGRGLIAKGPGCYGALLESDYYSELNCEIKGASRLPTLPKTSDTNCKELAPDIKVGGYNPRTASLLTLTGKFRKVPQITLRFDNSLEELIKLDESHYTHSCGLLQAEDTDSI